MNPLSDELPYWHFDDHMMVFKDGSLGIGFELTGFDLSCATADEVNGFCRNFENLLVSADDGMNLQIYYELSSDVESQIGRHEKQSVLEEGPLGTISKARINFLALQDNLWVKELQLSATRGRNFG